MSYRIFTISPGSTSTKCAVCEDSKLLFKENISHEPEVLKQFPTVNSQRPFRVGVVMAVLHTHGYQLRDMDAFAAYSGGLESTPGGIFPVNQKMLVDAMSGRIADHPAVLGSQIIGEFATALGKPAYVIDPPDVDELDDIARISGIKGVYRESHVHVLNQKEVARRMAAELGKKYDECNFIVCHVGGGLSIAAHCHGRMIDANDVVNGDGPMAPNRTGYVPLMPIVKMCYSGEYTVDDIKALITKNGGLKSLAGTDDIKKIKSMRDSGDKWAGLVYDAFAYNLGKYIGSYACVLRGKVDAIILTGGVSNDEEFVENIRSYTEWIAPVKAYGGDFEMEALAEGALRALRGEEELKEYTGVPVFSDFGPDMPEESQK